LSEEITQEQLENMSEAEFMEAIGKGKIKAGHIRTTGLNLGPQQRRAEKREKARRGLLPKQKPDRDKFGREETVHKNKFGLGYSNDPGNVDGESTLLQRQQKGEPLVDVLRNALDLE
jgi:hypothetical protein